MGDAQLAKVVEQIQFWWSNKEFSLIIFIFRTSIWCCSDIWQSQIVIIIVTYTTTESLKLRENHRFVYTQLYKHTYNQWAYSVIQIVDTFHPISFVTWPNLIQLKLCSLLIGLIHYRHDFEYVGLLLITSYKTDISYMKNWFWHYFLWSEYYLWMWKSILNGGIFPEKTTFTPSSGDFLVTNIIPLVLSHVIQDVVMFLLCEHFNAYFCFISYRNAPFAMTRTFSLSQILTRFRRYTYFRYTSRLLLYAYLSPINF